MSGKRRARRPKTPQEKKALSLARDRRDLDRGASRKGIAQRKRVVNRANRRYAQGHLMAALSTDAELAEGVETRIRRTRPKRWAKWPDTPLAEAIRERQERRQRRHRRKQRSRNRSVETTG